MMPPDTTNPLVIAAYVVGVLLSIPTLTMVVKGIFFLAKATTTLDRVDSGLVELKAEVRQLKHDRTDEAYSVELSLTIIEGDINELQRKASLPVRTYPDRRAGPPDRRSPA